MEKLLILIFFGMVHIFIGMLVVIYASYLDSVLLEKFNKADDEYNALFTLALWPKFLYDRWRGERDDE